MATDEINKIRLWDQIALLNDKRLSILNLIRVRRIATIAQLRLALKDMGFYGASKIDPETKQRNSHPALSWHTVRGHVLLLYDSGLLVKKEFPLIKAEYISKKYRDSSSSWGGRGKRPGRGVAVGYELSAEGERYLNSLDQTGDKNK